MRQRKSSLVLLAAAVTIAFASVADAKLAGNKVVRNRLVGNHLAANYPAEASNGAVDDVLAIQLADGALITR